jgi:hypothetical protein
MLRQTGSLIGSYLVPEDSEPSTDSAVVGEEVIANNESNDGVEVEDGGNSAPDSELVTEIQGEEREARIWM